jgi:hypothetical protein
MVYQTHKLFGDGQIGHLKLEVSSLAVGEEQKLDIPLKFPPKPDKAISDKKGKPLGNIMLTIKYAPPPPE